MLLAITSLTGVGLWARGRGLKRVLVDVPGRPRVALLEQSVEGNHQRVASRPMLTAASHLAECAHQGRARTSKRMSARCSKYTDWASTPW